MRSRDVASNIASFDCAKVPQRAYAREALAAIIDDEIILDQFVFGLWQSSPLCCLWHSRKFNTVQPTPRLLYAATLDLLSAACRCWKLAEATDLSARSSACGLTGVRGSLRMALRLVEVQSRFDAFKA